jgi:hypothetical protein
MELKRMRRNICPECDYQFKGNGFDGIDAHWRAKHEKPYDQAWPLIKAGTYKPNRGNINANGYDENDG